MRRQPGPVALGWPNAARRVLNPKVGEALARRDLALVKLSACSGLRREQTSLSATAAAAAAQLNTPKDEQERDWRIPPSDTPLLARYASL